MAVVTPTQLAAEIQQQTVRAPGTAATAVVSTLVRIQRDAALFAPVDTGFLEGSITWELHEPLEGEVGPEANYGIFVEEGTSRMAPQPYLAPAASRHEESFVDALEQAFGFPVAPTFGIGSPLAAVVGF